MADIWDSPDLELVTYYRGAKGSLLESERLSNVLDDLGEQFELVLVDTPPLLVLGDAMPLTSSRNPSVDLAGAWRENEPSLERGGRPSGERPGEGVSLR